MGKDQELLQAAREGNVEVVSKILEQRSRKWSASLRRTPGANIQDSLGYTPLHYAALKGHVEIVKLLLRADASPSTLGQNGSTPLHLAAWEGHVEIVRNLLDQNDDPLYVNLATKHNGTALHCAAFPGHTEVVALLLAKGADPVLHNDKGLTALDLAAENGRLETVRHLLHACPRLVGQYRSYAARGAIFDDTPLHRAARNGNEQVVNALLDAGIDINIRTGSKVSHGTALHDAALRGKVTVVNALLKRGASVDLVDRTNKTVLQVIHPLKTPVHERIKHMILRYRSARLSESDLDDDYPRIPVDLSPSDGYDNTDHRRSSDDMDHALNPEKVIVRKHDSNKVSSTSVKHHSHSFVQKITSKCLGLKAKFNSVPNISNSRLGSEVEVQAKTNKDKEDCRAKVNNTLHIGNSKFFKILSMKKEEPSEVVCNDEFDTISLDRLSTLDRSSVNNRSNRSCPGFKISLPNISENVEFCDSNDSIHEVASEAVNPSVQIRTILPYSIPESEIIDHMNEHSTAKTQKKAAESDLYLPCTKTEKQQKERIVPPRRHVNTLNVVYENVTIENRVSTPRPQTRRFIPAEPVREEGHVYENIPKTASESIKPVPAKRSAVQNPNEETAFGDSSNESTSEGSGSAPSSRTSTMSLDTKLDNSNFEDILLSKKSKSFRKSANIDLKIPVVTEDSSDSSSDASSLLGDTAADDDVASSSDEDNKKGDYLCMSRTMPKQNSKVEGSRKLFRNKTFFHGKRNSESLVNYHIRGTGYCVYKSPTVKEFIYVFNRETMKDDDVPPFTKVPNDRKSRYETPICFCRPDEVKHHKSADDLAIVNVDGRESPKVLLDIKFLERAASSFRCYCDDGSCSLHHHGSDLVVQFHAMKKSVSTPNLTRATPLEEPYAIVDLSSLKHREMPVATTLSCISVKRVSRQESDCSNDTSLSFGALSEPTTLSGALAKHSEVFRQESNCSNDTSLSFGALSETSTLLGSAVCSLSRSSSAGSSGSDTVRGSTEGLGVAWLDGERGGVGSGRRRWDEGEALSEADALSLSSAASGSLPQRYHHHRGYNKVSPTPPKKPPRRNLSVSPTHIDVGSYDYRRSHARSQDDLDDLQEGKYYLKHGRSVDQYVDTKQAYTEYDSSPRVAPVPKPRPSLKPRPQPVAITAMYENVAIKEQNPKRKLRRNPSHQYENFEPRMYQERSSSESILDGMSPDERYYDGIAVPTSPTHYEQPPTPDHPPPSAKHAENSIHDRIRPLSQEYKRRSTALRNSYTEIESSLLRVASAASVASGATDRSANTDNCVEEYVCDVPFAGLFKGSTTTLDGIGLRPVPAERPKTLRKLKTVYDPIPPEPSNGHEEDVVRRRSNTTSSNHSADKSLSILSPFDEQEEWAKISEIMASFGSKLVRESVFVSELEQEFTSRLGLSCSESSLSPSVVSSVGHWLNMIGLADYETLFIERGYDEVDFINGVIDENDLREMGIEETERSKILEAIAQLPLKIMEISTNHNNNNKEDQSESVEDWLKGICLEQYTDTFRKHLYVDMDRVRRIWEVELTAVLEIQKAGHRKRILASVSGLQNGPANNMDEINADLKTLKSNLQQLKKEIKEKEEKLPEAPPPRPAPPNLAPPGGETLKRSKKNRPAPQPPKPSDLEIRAPSELMVGVPGALKTQWRHQPFVLVSGAVTYVANYLGSTVVKELRGTESTKKSIQKLKKSTKEPRDSPDIILSISYRGVKFLNTVTRELVCEHEIRNIHCACQDADDLTHFAYITKDHTTKSHYCHVFCVATMDQATEVILTLGEAFEVAYQMALREQFTKNTAHRISSGTTGQQAKTPTHDPTTTSASKDKQNVNHGRSHSITEIKLNGHQLKIAPVSNSLSNEDFQISDGSRSPRTPMLKAPIASTEEL